MNSVKCKNCKLCDPIRSINARNPAHGICIPRSTYPAKENVGQVFPPGAKRAPEGEPAKPVVVEMDKVVTTCHFVVPKEQ